MCGRGEPCSLLPVPSGNVWQPDNDAGGYSIRTRMNESLTVRPAYVIATAPNLLGSW